jgi:ABC-type sugar transport system ATPase subunit
MSGAKPMSLRGLTKAYGATRALQGLDLDLVPGEVLGVAGPNGAGKSTLMRVLAGEEGLDSGKILIGERAASQKELSEHVAVVHQEPQLFPNMTLADNMLLGREGTSLNRPRMGRHDSVLIAALDLDRQQDMLIEDCSLSTRQRVEIARAIARRAEVFLFDEPNSALDAAESREMFAELHRLANEGNIVALVTHRLEDLVEHTSRVVVVREGRIAAQLTGDEVTEVAIAELLVQGLEAVNYGFRGGLAAFWSAPLGQPVLEVSQWTHHGGDFAPTDVKVPRSTVVSLLGVEGSGAREFLRSLAGLEAASGTIHLEGAGSGRELFEDVAYVAPSRTDSLFANRSIGQNALARLGRPEISGFMGRLSPQRMRDLVAAAVKRFRVKTQDPDLPITALSGGNQQKVAIAQALLKQPRLVLLEEPTRGVDIGSKREIYALLREIAQGGTGVIIFCTEVLEAFEASDQAYVFRAGRLSSPVEPAAFDRIEAFASAVAKAAGEEA